MYTYGSNSSYRTLLTSSESVIDQRFRWYNGHIYMYFVGKTSLTALRVLLTSALAFGRREFDNSD